MPAITQLPSMPNRGSATFSPEIEALLSAMPTMVSEMNTLAAGLSNASTNSTSSSSLTIGLGSKSLTVETGKGYVPGTLVVCAITASPTNWMFGEVTAYNSGTGAMTINVSKIQGSGTASAWTVSLSGPVGDQVVQGASVTSSAVDVTLTAASDRMQAVTMTASGKAVTLPAGSTLAEGGPVFIISKVGGYGFDIKSDSGALVGRLATSRFALCFLLDSASDLWRIAYADGDFAAGLPASFNAGSTTRVSVCALDATHALVCYCDAGNSNQGTACVLTISGSVVTAGAEAVFETGSTATSLAVCALSSSKAVVAYSDAGNSDYLTACVLDISGTTVTPGTPAVLASVDTYTSEGADQVSIAALSATHAIVTYIDQTAAANNGKAITFSVSGTTITAGSPVTFAAAATEYAHVCALSSTAAVVVYSNVASSRAGTARQLTVSGTTTTAPGSALAFESTRSENLTAMALSTSAVAVVWKDYAAGSAESMVISVSGSTLTANSVEVVQSSSSPGVFDPSACKIDATTIAVAFRESASPYTGYITTMAIDGTAMYEDKAETRFVTDLDNRLDICALSNGTVVAALQRVTTNVGTAVAIGT